MITHTVLFKTSPDVPPEYVEDVFTDLRNLTKKAPGILSFSGGAYSSDECLNRGFTHGFTMTFPSHEARSESLPLPEYRRVRGRIVEIVDGGLDGVLAFDYAS